MEQIIASDKTQSIAILMATYNGEKYLREQIDSIMSQSSRQWHLYIHDDGSKDGTVELLNDYANKYPELITVMGYPSQGGALQNFMSLLERVEADYYMFSDQDDVWHQDKIKKEIERMNNEESAHANKVPIIVYSDLIVVDAKLNKIADSFLAYSGIHPEFLTTFNELAASNLTTGCTMLFNHAVKEVVRHPFTAATMHDAWITLCTVKANGILAYISEPLIDYRQHGGNTLGAVSIKTLTLSYRFQHLKNVLKLNQKTYHMMQALGYGSWLKYIYYKIKYKYKIHKKLVGNDFCLHSDL